MWNVEDLEQADGSPSQRLSPYEAPSWSWASLNAKIHWLDYSQDFGDYRQLFVDVSSAETVPLIHDPMVQLKAGTLNIRGYLLPARIRKAHVGKGAVTDGLRKKRFIRSTNVQYRMEVDAAADYLVSLDEYTLNGYGTTKIKISHQNGAAIYLDTPLVDEVAVEAALLPVCMPWTNGKSADNWRVGGLILQRSAGVVEESLIFSRIGVFALSSSDFETKYGFDGRGFDFRWKQSLETKDMTII